MYLIPEGIKKPVPVLLPGSADQGRPAEQGIERFHYFIPETDVPGEQIMKYTVRHHGETVSVQIDHHIITAQYDFIHIKLDWCFIRYFTGAWKKLKSFLGLKIQVIYHLLKRFQYTCILPD